MSKIEEIEAAETQIESLSTEEAQMRDLYMQDGTIDDTEQEALDRINGKIQRLQDVVARLRAEWEENKRIWESHGAEWSEAQNQLGELRDFGHAEAGVVNTSVEAVGTAESEQRYADATAEFGQLTLNLSPIWEDYLRQKEAKAEYEPIRIDFDARLNAVNIAEPQTEAVSSGVVSLRGNVGPIDTAVSSKDFVTALELINTGVSELEAVEAELTRAQEAKAAYEDGLASLQPRLTEASVCEYARLAEQQSAIVSLQTEMETAAEGQDFETANTKVGELTTAVDAFLAERDELDSAKSDYEAKLGTLQGRIDASKMCEAPGTEELQQAITTPETAMLAAAEAEDFPEALRLAGDVETALDAYEAAVDDHQLYEARREAMQDELIEASQSQAKWDYLMPIQADMARIQTDMEAAADAADFETALSHCAALEAKLVEFYAAIDAKRAEYEAARAPLEPRLTDMRECAWPLEASKASVETIVGEMDASAADEDWEAALNGVGSAEVALNEFDTAREAENTNVRNDVNSRLPAVKTALNADPSASSSTKTQLSALVAEIEGATSSSGDLNEVPDKMNLAEDLANDLAVVNQINARLNAIDADDQDSEAVAIVEELKNNPEEIANLPFEARNRLIEEMLAGDTDSDEQTAIQDLWASTRDTVDPAFEAQDAELTSQMLRTLEDDPEVQEFAANWSSMSAAEKTDAMAHIGGIIGGENGYDLENIDDIAFTADGARGTTDCATSSTLRGWHGEASGDLPEEISVCTNNNYTLRNGSEWNPNEDMGDVIMNLTHEVGHGYQEELIDRLESGDLGPGDAEYEQARALQMDREYFGKFPEDYTGSTYIHSPMEQLSRITANRVGDDLPDGYGTGYEQEL